MSRNLLAGVIAAAALVSITAPAVACPHGYVKGSIQGNKVCHLPPGGNNQYQANPHGQRGDRNSPNVETLRPKRHNLNVESQNSGSIATTQVQQGKQKSTR